MVKLLFLITKDDVGGAQKYVRDLAENLDSKKFAVRILAGGKGGARFLSNAFRPYFLFLNDLAALLELVFIFRREKPDVVHLNSSKAGVIGAVAAKLAGIPGVVFTVHGWIFNPDNDLSFWRRRFYILLHKLAARFQNWIINVSEYDRQLALKYQIAPVGKLLTIYNGIAEIPLLSKKDSRKAIKTISGQRLDLDSIWVGSVGRLVAEKDYETLVRAANFVPGAHFIILGSGPQYQKLKGKIQKLGLADRFSILENIAPAAPYLRAFDIFVLSSIKEGLPYTMLEAMAVKLPIVVTRVGGMTEIIQDRGLVMPPREPEELARAIQHFIDHPQEADQAAAEANRFLKERLTLERMVEETANVYLS